MPAHGQSALATDDPESRTLKLQTKVDELFEQGEFERAYFIYRNELVPLGDKYAQYMVGYMLLTGTGVDEDPVAASAWYRLAAERDTPEFVAVRDQLLHDMPAAQRGRSDVLYMELRRKYSDLVVLLSSIRRSLSELEPRTGSRLSTGDNAVTIIDTRSPRTRAGADYYSRIRRQLTERLTRLSELGEFPDLETDPDRVNINELERLVGERLESLD